MKSGKLQLGNEAVPVEYEIQSLWVGTKREISGTCTLLQKPGSALLSALAQMTGANLVTEEGQVYWVEFTHNADFKQVEFKAIPPQAAYI